MADYPNGNAMDKALFEHAAQARTALRSIMSDQPSGTGNLPDPQTAANLLQDLLADAPRECSILVAAIATGAPAMLHGYIAQGMNSQMAVSLTAAALAERTAIAPEGCRWATAEIALALGVAESVATANSGQIPRAANHGKALAVGRCNFRLGQVPNGGTAATGGSACRR